MIDLNDVALFVHVVRSGSFAQASRTLDMPSSTISRRIQQLEDHLGVRLLQRTTRKLMLTGPGEQFHERCKPQVDELFEVARELTTGLAVPHGMVRVAVPADFFDFFHMSWAADFLAKYPGVQIDFVLSDAKADLINDRIDVAFRGGRLEDSGLIGRRVLSNGGDCLVASPLYVQARGMPGGLADLTNHDCVGFSSPTNTVEWRVSTVDGREEVVQLGLRLSCNTAQAIRKAAVAGIGVALLPRALVAQDLLQGALVPVLADYGRRGDGLNVLYPSRKHLPTAVAAFIELAIEKLMALEAAMSAPDDRLGARG